MVLFLVVYAFLMVAWARTMGRFIKEGPVAEHEPALEGAAAGKTPKGKAAPRSATTSRRKVSSHGNHVLPGALVPPDLRVDRRLFRARRFRLGAGVLYPFVAKGDEEKAVVRTSIGPVWDGKRGVAAHRRRRAVRGVPGGIRHHVLGFYLAVMLVLFGLIVRAVSLEYRGIDHTWAKVWGRLLLRGLAAAALLLGVAVGNILRGHPHERQRRLHGHSVAGPHHPVHAAVRPAGPVDVPGARGVLAGAQGAEA